MPMKKEPVKSRAAEEIAALPTDQPLKKLLMLASRAGEILLSSGAETSRVEQTVTMLVTAFGVKQVQTLVITTGLFISIDAENLEYPLTLVRRVPRRSLNYTKIAAINQLSRQLVRHNLSLDEALQKLDAIEQAALPYPFWLGVVAGGGSAASTTLLLGGGPLDVLPAFISTILILLFRRLLEKSNVPAIFGEFFGAALATAIALGLNWFGLPLQTTLVITGGIIQLVPGAALVASVQDGIAGELISSAARGLETFLKGAALASGVGLTLSGALALGVSISLGKTTGEAWQIPIQVVAAFCAGVCYAIANYIPRFAIATAGLNCGLGWLTHLLVVNFGGAPLLATFLAALVVGAGSWELAYWQRAPITLYILPGILPLLPGLTIYQGMLELARNQSLSGLLLLAQAVFLGGALAGGVALSNSLMRPLLRYTRRRH